MHGDLYSIREFQHAEYMLTCRLRASSFSLRLGHARGKTTLSCFLTLSRRFATRSAWRMRTHRIKTQSIFIPCRLRHGTAKQKKDTHKGCVTNYGNLLRLARSQRETTEQCCEPIAHGYGAVSGVRLRCLTAVGNIAKADMCAGFDSQVRVHQRKEKRLSH